MLQTKFKVLIVCGVLALAMFAQSPAEACWRNHCGWGGGWGGCYSGCYGGGCYGGWGGWGGYGGYGYGGYGWGGYYGGVSYGSPNWGWYGQSNYYPTGTYAGHTGIAQNTSKVPADSGRLSLEVPADAVVYINGQRTSSTGKQREYLSKGLTKGGRYDYVVRVDANRDGKPVSETRTVQLIGGGSTSLAFAPSADKQLAAAPAQLTRLVVKLPAEAQLYLGGNKTQATGPVREFATKALPSGDQWTSYTVRATIERDGKMVETEQVVSLKAGETQELSLDFAPEPAKVASAE